jgi:hypothetical protein
MVSYRNHRYFRPRDPVFIIKSSSLLSLQPPTPSESIRSNISISEFWLNSLKESDLFAVHTHWKTPLGNDYREKYVQTLKKCYDLNKNIKTNGLLTPLQRGRLEWHPDTLCLRRTESDLRPQRVTLTKTFHYAHNVYEYLCVWYGSHNKQRLFP